MCCLPETEDIENAAEKQQEKKENLEELETAAGQQEEKKTDLELLQIMHEKEKRLLNSFLEIPELDAENEHLRRQELMVKALEYMLGMMSHTENPIDFYLVITVDEQIALLETDESLCCTYAHG